MLSVWQVWQIERGDTPVVALSRLFLVPPFETVAFLHGIVMWWYLNVWGFEVSEWNEWGKCIGINITPPSFLIRAAAVWLIERTIYLEMEDCVYNLPCKILCPADIFRRYSRWGIPASGVLSSWFLRSKKVVGKNDLTEYHMKKTSISAARIFHSGPAEDPTASIPFQFVSDIRTLPSKRKQVTTTSPP